MTDQHKTTDPLAVALDEWNHALREVSDAADLRAVLARHGLVVVPVEPTEAMIMAGYSAGWERAGITEDVWRVMVEAARV